MENCNENETPDKSENKREQIKPETVFKKPILFGKIGRLPKKLHKQFTGNTESTLETNVITENKDKPVVKEIDSQISAINDPGQVPAQERTDKSVKLSLPYTEPSWSGLPNSNGKDYSFDVLKNGTIIETVSLMEKPFWVFGKLANCDICMQHPTISRYHAVLQYRKEASESDGSGFYIYDLGSTHGTFLNKNRLKPKVFVRIQVGHMLKFGCSTRSYILEGPEYDEEEESELSVSELKQKRDEEIRQREEAILRLKQEAEEKKRKEEERGVDWGLGEDADEETDLSENPYAQTSNEELYLDDPKKALRGFFEREGLELEYDCNEQGIGQFLCKVELPVDDEMGRPIVAEVLHKGKKKEAVIQCALEACRILDRYGVLRQATHESRKRKAKNWEDNDYYDSDEDTFLDRTGTIEKKREKRMNAKAPQKVETYESLVAKEKSISSSINGIEKQLISLQLKIEIDSNRDNDEDSLDSYMKELKDSKPDKKTVAKLKADLAKLKTEHNKVVQLINIVKPANLPPLIPKVESAPSTSKGASSLPIFGKRKKIQFKFEPKSNVEQILNNDMGGDEEEEEDEDDEGDSMEKSIEAQKQLTDSETFRNMSENAKNDFDEPNSLNTSETLQLDENPQDVEDASRHLVSAFSDEPVTYMESLDNTTAFKKFESIIKKGLPRNSKYQANLEIILHNLKVLASTEDSMIVDWKTIVAKQKKIMKLVRDMRFNEPSEKLQQQVAVELRRIFSEMNTVAERKYHILDRVERMGNEINVISETYKNKQNVESTKELRDCEIVSSPTDKSIDEVVNKDSSNERLIEEETSSHEESIEAENSTDQKKKKKNLRRIHQRQEKQEHERQRGYEEDASRENYNMWVPPSDQSGDGRTSLNDKYGY